MSSLKNVFIAGHEGMVGSAIVKLYSEISDVNLILSKRNQLDLRNQDQVAKFFQNNKIDEVIIAAAKVGGVSANNEYPAEFIYDNIMIESNIINCAHINDVQKLLFLGSSCIYPRMAKQPITEAEMLNGHLEKTNEPYAIAKIAGIKLCESYNRQFGRDYRTIIPTNLYGENDNFNVETSHVIPGLIHRFYNAVQSNDKHIYIWGTGNQLREFMHVDDMASACYFIMSLDKEKYSSLVDSQGSFINAGSGKEITIKSLAEIIARITGFKGEIKFDTNRPDGTPKKLLNISKLKKSGWTSKIELEKGLKSTYKWFVNNYNIIKK